jgi:glycosyltransferase involved in cell wall biosynthesis
LAPEKNQDFLARAVAGFLAREARAHYLLIGSGPSKAEIRRIFDEAGVSERLHLAGTLQGQELIDAYHAMDVFAFASCSETQGMVLTEAMAAGVPVVALDAPGVREVVRDGVNGRLLAGEDIETFAEALACHYGLASGEREACRRAALRTATDFSIEHCAQRALEAYDETLRIRRPRHALEKAIGLFETLFEEFKAEWGLLVMIAAAAAATLNPAAKEAEHE